MSSQEIANVSCRNAYSFLQLFSKNSDHSNRTLASIHHSSSDFQVASATKFTANENAFNCKFWPLNYSEGQQQVLGISKYREYHGRARSVLSWVIIQRVLVISYRLLGNPSVPSSSPSNPWKMELKGCPKTLVINYHCLLRNNTDRTVLISFTAEAWNKAWNSKLRMNKRLHKLSKSVCFCTVPWWHLVHLVLKT